MRMKQNLKSFLVLGALFAFLTAFMACSKDDAQTESPPSDPQKLIYTSSASIQMSGQGEGTVASPLISTATKPAEVKYSLHSVYSDPDGSTFECEPKSTVKLMVRESEVSAKNLAELTTIKENVTNDSKGANPATKLTHQTFTLGSQTITFDLSHEIYTHTDSRNRQVEMPYVNISKARYGEAQADQATRGIQAVAVTGIKLTPIEPMGTRGVVLRDSTMYNVNVSFNLDIENKNTNNDHTTSLSFEVEYIGVVENITELPDPSTEYLYQLNILGGTTSTVSPFMVTPGEELSLEWVQNSRYTYFSATELMGKTLGQKPKATFNLSVLQDTLQIETLDALEQSEELPVVEETGGENPTRHVIRQSFNVCGNLISLTGIYESYAPIEMDGEQIQLPYLMLSRAEIVSVNSTELTGVSLPKPSDKAYEVTVRFRQSLTGVNTPDEISENIEYIVRFTAVLDNKLISTTYEKDYKWYEAHDNMATASRYILRRIRTYASGEKITDTFVAPYIFFCGGGTSVLVHSDGGDPRYDSEYQKGNIHFVYSSHQYKISDDLYTAVECLKTGVPDINLVKWHIYDMDWFERNFSFYMNVFNSSRFMPDNPIDGWYSTNIAMVLPFRLDYSTGDDWIILCANSFDLNDHFLCLDGQVFDFPEFLPTYETDFREEPTTLADGTPAKIFTGELRVKYLEHDFYCAVVDTIYQLPK